MHGLYTCFSSAAREVVPDRVPRSLVRNEDVGRRREPVRVVECRERDVNLVRPTRSPKEEVTATSTAELALALRRRREGRQRRLAGDDLESIFGEAGPRDE